MSERPKRPSQIITAWACGASGPGWANSPVWYAWRDDDGVVRIDAIQPGNQTDAMASMYRVSEAASDAMTGAVMDYIRDQKYA